MPACGSDGQAQVGQSGTKPRAVTQGRAAAPARSRRAVARYRPNPVEQRCRISAARDRWRRRMVEARERLVRALINKKKKANPPGTNHVLSMLQALINQLPALTTY